MLSMPMGLQTITWNAKSDLGRAYCWSCAFGDFKNSPEKLFSDSSGFLSRSFVILQGKREEYWLLDVQHLHSSLLDLLDNAYFIFINELHFTFHKLGFTLHELHFRKKSHCYMFLAHSFDGIINTYSMKQPDLYHFEAIKMTSQA